jgi:MFS family permease
MSVAVIPMAKELGWSATERGLVSSSFFWGYSLTQVPAGYISTKIGGAKARPAAPRALLRLCHRAVRARAPRADSCRRAVSLPPAAITAPGGMVPAVPLAP